MAAKHTEKDVKEKMAQLGIPGWSSMGEFTPDDLMERLEDIQALTEERKEHVAESKRKSGGKRKV